MKCPEEANPQSQSTLVTAREWREGAQGVTANGNYVSFWYDENVLELRSGITLVMAAQLCEHTEKLQKGEFVVFE